MGTLSSDTAPDIEGMQIEHLRGMPARRKPALVGEMNRAVRAMALAGLRQRYPEDTPDRRRRRLATRAYGPGPEDV